jgi:SAM-dependent methyltransferase
MNKAHLREADEFRRMLNGFQASRIIITANNFKVFGHLRSARDADALAREISADRRATEILCDALTSLGLLRKTAGRYRNSPLATRLLAGPGPLFQGDMVRHAETLWKNWAALDEVMTTGRPARKAHDRDAFIRAMDNNASLRVDDVVRALDLRGVRRALDLGGGPGTYGMALAKKGVRVTLFDLPDTISIARDVVGKTAKNIEFREGDFLSDDIGNGFDLVFISQIVHIFDERENLQLLEKAKAALNPGGRVAVHDFYLEPGRTSPPSGALFGVNMLVNTDAGRSYALKEIRSWLVQAGFKAITVKRVGVTVLVQGKKRS